MRKLRPRAKAARDAEIKALTSIKIKVSVLSESDKKQFDVLYDIHNDYIKAWHALKDPSMKGWNVYNLTCG